MIDMPVKDQKRLNIVWLEVMGETEMPDDRRTVMETVAKFETQSGCASLQGRPVPRRVAPPPPTGHILKRAAELDEDIRRNDRIASPKSKERSTGSADSAVLKAAQSAESTPVEKLDSPSTARPIPKPRKKVSELQYPKLSAVFKADERSAHVCIIETAAKSEHRKITPSSLNWPEKK
ncbi:hypothetical protein ANCCAN_09828 [Ancylostoma caninum]|uniref:Uncharacterized protein n=1 Tax=Ancylostoma caninum TaxID=29170 RepID=A0A368GMI5_ANCCA|nr:hypothetical protein ANCCAN_09828 [Ancylostoma caninum]